MFTSSPDPAVNGTPVDPVDPNAPTAVSRGEAPDDGFAPPEDFGAAVLAEFERRAADAPVPTDDVGAPPGGFPPKQVDDTAPASAPASADGTEASGEDGQGPPEGGATPPSGDPAAPATPDLTAPPTPDPADDGTSPADAAPTPASATGYAWQMGDETVEFSDEQVQRSLGLAAWAEQLPDQTRAQFAAIEQGQAVAIPRADFEAFQAYQAQQSRSTRDADLSDLADVDPDVAKLISGFRDEVATLKGQAPADAGSSLNPQEQANIQQNLDATAEQFDAATRGYGETHGLTPEDLDTLMADAVSAQIIPTLMESNSTFNPATGQLLRPADIGLVTEQALDFALARNPALHSRVIAHQHTGATGTNPPPTPADPAAAANAAGIPGVPDTDPVLAKRARAASLASAPSAAVAPSPRDSQTLSPQERVDAMAAEIQAALAAS